MSTVTRFGISLIPLQQKVTREDLLTTFPKANRIVAVDLYLQGAENWERIPGGWQCQFRGVTFINVDHHAPVQEMMRPVSSGNLATDYVRTYDIFKGDKETVVVINHCDCDSIVASSILVGNVNPEYRFQEAVIAADHTGEADPIADALQALEEKRDLQLSLQTIEAFRLQSSLPPQAQEALRKRIADRESLVGYLEQNRERIYQFGSVVMIEADERIATEMLPALIPEAKLILCSIPRGAGKHDIKARLGASAPKGQNLFSLGLWEFDPAFGGRWNAGSNRRGENGGTTLTPYEYGRQLAELVAPKLG